jgi:nitrogen regulatory protein PII-like uncharacterized protein
MLEKIQGFNIPMTLFMLYVLRLIFLGTNVAEAITVFALAGLYGFYIYINKEKDERYSSALKEINKIKDLTNAINLKIGIKRDNVQAPGEKRLF